MPEPTSDVPQPTIVLPEASTITPPSVLNQPILSAEDKMVLYAILQDIADELRRIKRERKKQHQTESK